MWIDMNQSSGILWVVSWDYWGIEVGVFNDDATPVPEALSSSILESDARADLAV